MKAYSKEIKRTIHKSLGRFFSILLIVALGTGVFAGIKATSDDMLITSDKYFSDKNMADITIISTSGINKSLMKKIASVPSIEYAEGVFSAEAVLSMDERTASARFMSLPENISTLTLVDGRMPENKNECVIIGTKEFNKLTDIGSTVKFSEPSSFLQESYTIVGKVNSSEFISFDLGSSTVGSGHLDYAFYTVKDSFTLHSALNVNSSVNIKVMGTKGLNTYSEEYDKLVDNCKNSIVSAIGNIEGVYILDRNQNAGFAGYEGDAEKIAAISKVFPAFFFLVAALVCLTTMTRMVEEDRTQIGTLKALGYGKLAIMSKYVIYSFLATLLGSVIGLIVGYNVFPRTIFAAYSIMYTLPAIETPFHWGLGLISTGAFLLCTEIFTVAACLGTANQVPALLMQPKAPQSGKRILLEHITPLWNRFSFNQKVAARNIFRYKKRLFMTIIGIAGCTALTLAGFGLKNSISDIIVKQFDQIMLYDYKVTVTGNASSDNNSEVFDIAGKYDSKCISYFEKFVDTYNDSGDVYNAYIICPDISPENDSFRQLFFSLHSREKDPDDREYYSLSEDSVIITEKLSSKLNLKTGDSISFSISDGGRKDFKISAIAENYAYNYVYILPSLFEAEFGYIPDYTFCAGILPDGTPYNSAEAEAMAAEMLNLDGVMSVSFKEHTKAAFTDAIESLNIVVVVLIICAAALAIIVIYNLANINITERIREIATIKVLGFTDTEVTSYVFRESVLLTIMGILVGFVLGIQLHKFVIITAEVEMVMFGRDIYNVSYLFAALLTLGFSLAVNFAMHKRLKNVSMTESLKSTE